MATLLKLDRVRHAGLQICLQNSVGVRLGFAGQACGLETEMNQRYEPNGSDVISRLHHAMLARVGSR